MRVRIFIIFLWTLLASALYAIPARRGAIVFTQKDRTQIAVYLHGDEHFHYQSTDDGLPIAQGADSSFYYLSVSDSHWLVTDLLAHDKADRTSEEMSRLAEFSAQALLFLEERRNSTQQRRLQPAQIELKEIDSTQYRGSRKGLIILVNFSDLSMLGDDPQADFYRQANEHGYHENNHVGSVRDYFHDQSYGAFDLQFDVVGPVTLSKSVTYYGENDVQLDRTDIHAREMVVEACTLADSLVNYADYDWDSDGQVEQIFIIYAGFGESSGAPTYTIWPHRSSLSSSPLVLDGVTITDYACSCELAHASGSIRNGIGTICHEFSHCLSLPDFYDINYNGGIGMQYWDIMASGSYNGPDNIGEVPSGYTAYERAALGWLQLIELSDTTHVRGMASLDSLPEAYAIYNDATRNEYFTLENRQSSRWFTYVDSYTDFHGLLILHVNYHANMWMSNMVNTNGTRQRMSFVPADNDYGHTYGSSNYYQLTEDDLRGDLFPGSQGVTSFTPQSHASVGGKWLNATQKGTYTLSYPVLNIRERDGKISFDYIKGIDVPLPQNLSAEQIDREAFRVRWILPSKVDSCVVEIQEVRSSDSSRPGLDGLINLIKPLDYHTCTLVDVDTCVFTNLTATSYRYRARAVIDDVLSEWTDYGEISLDSTFSSIEERYADTPIHRTQVYNLQGIKIMSGSHISFSDLPRGTYILVEGLKRRVVRK
jgi:M6 family metalloprotease-like protein